MYIDDLFLIFAVLIALLVIAGCGDEYRNHTECRKVADLIEGVARHDLRAIDQMDTLTSQETMLLAATVESADPYKRCMEINR